MTVRRRLPCILVAATLTTLAVASAVPSPLMTTYAARSDARRVTRNPHYSGFQTTASIETVRDKTAFAPEQNTIVSGAPAPPAPLVAPIVIPGGQQTVTLRTKPRAFVALVVTYPSGKPLVVGPLMATATGRFTYSFTVPRGTRDGRAGVVIVAAGGVIQGSFSIVHMG